VSACGGSSLTPVSEANRIAVGSISMKIWS